MPLYVAALTSQAVELAGELADGIMPLLWTAERVAQSKAWAAGPRQGARTGPLDITLGLPTFIGDDLEALRDAARAEPRPVHGPPVLPAAVSRQRLRRRGRPDGAGRGAGLAQRPPARCDLPHRAVERCREQLAAFRAAGLDLPILYPPIGVDGARAVIAAFRR